MCCRRLLSQGCLGVRALLFQLIKEDTFLVKLEDSLFYVFLKFIFETRRLLIE